MPIMTRPVSELTDHIFMPVVRQLAHRLLSSLGYSEIIGDQIYINTDWSTHSSIGTSDDNANVRQNRLSIETNLQLNPTSQKWDFYTFHHTTAYGIDQRTLHNSDPIYFDKRNQVEITQCVAPATIVMNCDLVFESSEFAFQTPQMIFNHFENGSVFSFTDLFFDYPAPKPIVSMLLQFWEMDRDFGKPANISFEEYIKIRSNGGWQVRKHRDLDQYEIVIPVNNLKALCTLEYSEDRPSGIMENKLPVGWSISFVYTIQFAIPTLNILRYPILINNQLLPDNMIITDKHQRFNNMIEFHHGKADEKYHKGHNLPTQFHIGIANHYPWYDDWTVPTDSPLMMKSRVPVAIIALTVEEDTPINVIGLKEDFDEDFKLSPLIKEMLYQEDYHALDYYAPYQISVFKENRQIGQEALYFDGELTLKFKANNLYERYRIVISVAKDTYHIRPRWHKLLAKYFEYLPNNLKLSMINRFLNGDWKKGLPKKTDKITMKGEFVDIFGKVVSKVEDFNFDKYTKPAASPFPLEDRPFFKNVNDYGGDNQIPNSPNVGANKGNVGRVDQPFVDGGIYVDADHSASRVISTSIIARETDVSSS